MAIINKKNEIIFNNSDTIKVNSEVDSTNDARPFIIGNIGLWYYRTFFKRYNSRLKEKPDESKKEFAVWLQDEYKSALESKWGNYSEVSVNSFGNIRFNEQVPLKTIYPGLVCGIGYEHELGFENEFKLGFSFDHTTGLPYIPGSSVKGTLRSAFGHNGYPESIFREWIGRFNKVNENEWPWKLDETLSKLETIAKLENIANRTDWKKLENHIFEGIPYLENKALSSYTTDVFFDAFISNSSEANGGKFLADDYITCHQNRKDESLSPFTNPNPVRFLKVRSDVEFTFGFRLSNIDLGGGVTFSKEIKRELFKQILLDLGIGAKTNVGYGQFEAVKDLPTETSKEEKVPDGLSEQNEV